jgi:hypothetical protein
MVIFVAEGKESLKSMKTCKVEKDGAYAVKLDAAGHYSVSVQQDSAAWASRARSSSRRRSPSEGAQARPRDADRARQRTVLGPDGEPAVGRARLLHPESAVATGTRWGGQYHEGATDADGRFDVNFLRAGNLLPRGRRQAFGGLMGGDDAAFGREVAAGSGFGRRVECATPTSA